MKWYITSRVSSLVTALSHWCWYLLIIYNKIDFWCLHILLVAMSLLVGFTPEQKTVACDCIASIIRLILISSWTYQLAKKVLSNSPRLSSFSENIFEEFQLTSTHRYSLPSWGTGTLYILTFGEPLQRTKLHITVKNTNCSFMLENKTLQLNKCILFLIVLLEDMVKI